jgi:hypothetical protein
MIQIRNDKTKIPHRDNIPGQKSFFRIVRHCPWHEDYTEKEKQKQKMLYRFLPGDMAEIKGKLNLFGAPMRA